METECIQDLVDMPYPGAEFIRVVMDYYYTYRPASLYKAFSHEEDRRIFRVPIEGNVHLNRAAFFFKPFFRMITMS